VGVGPRVWTPAPQKVRGIEARLPVLAAIAICGKRKKLKTEHRFCGRANFRRFARDWVVLG